MMNRKLAIISSVVLALSLLWAVRVAMAQDGGEPDHITRWTIGASSGGVITSSSFIMAGTTGQVNTSISSESDHYSSGGIWPPLYIPPPWVFPTPGPAPLPTPAPPLTVPVIEEPEVPPLDEFDSMEGGTYFPETLNLPGCPYFDDPPIFPTSFYLPEFPSLDPPDFPDTLGLPSMPTLTMMSYITEVFDSVYSLTYAIVTWDTIITSALFLPQGLADATGIGIDGFEGGGGSSSINTFELAGYSAEELADELVSGIDTALSYIRSIESIGVIGPTAAALLMGMMWIAFVAFAKIVIKFLLLVINMVLKLWRLLPFT